MVIVLKGANASANNVGHIDIPTANLVSLAINGSESVKGLSAQYTCTATYDDGSTREVTNMVSWSLDSATYASISGGLLTIKDSASTTQSVTINASLDGKSASLNVSVKYQPASDETMAIIDAYGNKSMTADQIKAVETFLNNIESNGIKSRMRGVWMPMIAASVDKSLVNAKDGNATATPSSERYVLDEYGIKDSMSSNSTSNIVSLGSIGDDVYANNCFVGAFYADKTKAAMTWHSTNNSIAHYYYSTNNAIAGNVSSTPRLASVAIQDLYGTSKSGGMIFGGKTYSDIGSCMLSIKDSVMIMPTTQGEAVETNKVDSATDLSVASWSGVRLGYNYGVSREQGASILMFGESLTKEQMWALDAAVVELFKAFGYIE